MHRKYDFDRLKGLVSVADVLRAYGLDRGLREERGELVGPCPLPGHGGDRDNRGAFRANPAKGRWHCLSRCGGGDVVALVMEIEGCDHAEAARMLADIEAGCSTTTPRPTPPRPSPARPRPFRPFTKRLRLEPDHPLLRTRDIRPETASVFEAGWWPLGGLLEGCVAVRLHDPAGNALGYTGRRLDWHKDADFPKWRVPAGFPKSAVLFNWHRARCHLGSGVIVVEGPWDVMRITQAGFPGAVALLGHDLSAAQRALLATAPRVVLLLDGDDAGREGARKAAAALHPLPVEVVGLPDGSDPADLSDGELRGLLGSFFSSPCLASSP